MGNAVWMMGWEIQAGWWGRNYRRDDGAGNAGGMVGWEL